MERITIGSPDEKNLVVMPRVRTVEVGSEEVSTEREMASGRLVKEMKGTRAVVTAEWEWLPVETVAALHALLRRGGYFYAEYPDPVEGSVSGLYKVECSPAKIFRFIDGKPRWYGVSLSLTGQEVR